MSLKSLLFIRRIEAFNFFLLHIAYLQVLFCYQTQRTHTLVETYFFIQWNHPRLTNCFLFTYCHNYGIFASIILAMRLMGISCNIFGFLGACKYNIFLSERNYTRCLEIIKKDMEVILLEDLWTTSSSSIFVKTFCYCFRSSNIVYIFLTLLYIHLYSNYELNPSIPKVSSTAFDV